MILQDNWDALEADFTRFYNTDLRGACFGEHRWGARRVLVHVDGLPADSAFARSLLNGRHWSQEMELSARVGDEVASLRALVSAALGLKPQMPEPFPRPNAPAPEEPAPVTPQQLADFLRE